MYTHLLSKETLELMRAFSNEYEQEVCFGRKTEVSYDLFAMSPMRHSYNAAWHQISTNLANVMCSKLFTLIEGTTYKLNIPVWNEYVSLLAKEMEKRLITKDLVVKESTGYADTVVINENAPIKHFIAAVDPTWFTTDQEICVTSIANIDGNLHKNYFTLLRACHMTDKVRFRKFLNKLLTPEIKSTLLGRALTEPPCMGKPFNEVYRKWIRG